MTSWDSCSGGSPGLQAGGAPLPGKILIIDDEADVMKMLVYRLKARGYETVTAQDGRAGIEKARKHLPGLIILDYWLPDMKAVDISAELKSAESTGSIPIIMMTASVENMRDKKEECGACDCLLKPIGPEELYAKVEKYIDLRREVR
ncbi:MAG: response regulator [Candidatus Omnitrophota bacterium]